MRKLSDFTNVSNMKFNRKLGAVLDDLMFPRSKRDRSCSCMRGVSKMAAE